MLETLKKKNPLIASELDHCINCLEALRDETLRPGDGETVTGHQITAQINAARESIERIDAWTKALLS